MQELSAKTTAQNLRGSKQRKVAQGVLAIFPDKHFTHLLSASGLLMNHVM